MFCSNCGTELDPNARFCRKCGDPQTLTTEPAATRRLGQFPPAAPPGSTAEWEVCAIMHEILEPGGLLNKTQDRYWAQATGPRGTYRAGETPLLNYRYSRAIGVFISPIGAKRRAAYQALIDQLVRDGWEPLPTVANQLARFRRPVQ